MKVGFTRDKSQGYYKPRLHSVLRQFHREPQRQGNELVSHQRRHPLLINTHVMSAIEVGAVTDQSVWIDSSYMSTPFSYTKCQHPILSVDHLPDSTGPAYLGLGLPFSAPSQLYSTLFVSEPISRKEWRGQGFTVVVVSLPSALPRLTANHILSSASPMVVIIPQHFQAPFCTFLVTSCPWSPLSDRCPERRPAGPTCGLALRP